MNMRPVAHRYVYVDKSAADYQEFHTLAPIEAVPVRVEHLYSADQLAMAQEAVKIKSALIIKGVINGDIYADRIRKIEILR